MQNNFTRRENEEILHFILCGILSALIYFVTLFIEIEILSIKELTSITISFSLSSLFNFLYNRTYTFKKKNLLNKQITNYLLMLGISYLITVFIIKSLCYFLNLYFLSVISILTSAIFRFIFSKKIVY